MNLSAEIARRIVARAADCLGAGVSVADRSGRVLASTEPDFIGAAHPLTRTATAGGETTECSDGSWTGVAAPLVYDDAAVGAVLLHDEPERSRRVIGVVKAMSELLIHQAAVIERLPDRRRLVDRFLAALLLGHFSPECDAPVQEGALLEIDLRVPRVVVAFDVGVCLSWLACDGTPHAAVPEVARARRLDRVRTRLVNCTRRPFSTRAGDVYGFVDDRWLVALVTLDGADPTACRPRVVRRAERSIEEISRAARVRCAAGIGRSYPGWQGLSRSFADARLAAEYGAQRYGVGHAVDIETLGLAAFLAAPDEAARERYAARLLDPLDDSPELLATLDAFLAHDLSPSRAAQALDIHRHTLGYRLDKIARLTGVDPRRFEDAAQFHAARLLRRLKDPADLRFGQWAEGDARADGDLGRAVP